MSFIFKKILCISSLLVPGTISFLLPFQSTIPTHYATPSRPSSSTSSNEVLYTPPTWTCNTNCSTTATISKSLTPELQSSLTTLATTTIALLAGDESSASALLGGATNKRHVISQVFGAYDVCQSGTLSVEEAQLLFVDLARSIVTELAYNNNRGEEEDCNTNSPSPAQLHAQRVLTEHESSHTIDRVARKLLLLADLDHDGKVNLGELAMLFETIFRANVDNHHHNNNTMTVNGEIWNVNDNLVTAVDTFPQPLRALAGSLQLLPPKERASPEAADRSQLWNVGVPGDDHTLRRVMLEDNSSDVGKNSKSNKKTSSISLVGLGRSADASAYFLPELGIALDAGLHVSSLQPRTVLLTHGHRDHTGALPVHNSHNALILVPESIEKLVHNFLIAEAQLNYGDASQTKEETLTALEGQFNIQGVSNGTRIMLSKEHYSGPPTPIGIEVLTAPHKEGVPAVSYGIFRQKQRLKAEYSGMSNSELGAILRSKRDGGDEVSITESYDEGILFYTGDTTITLLRERWRSILPKYKFIIHEVTFLGEMTVLSINSIAYSQACVCCVCLETLCELHDLNKSYNQFL